MQRVQLMFTLWALLLAACSISTPSMPTLAPTATLLFPAVSNTPKAIDTTVPTTTRTIIPPTPTLTPIPMPAGSGIQLLTTGAQAKVVYQSQLRSPEGITVGPDGALYIADWVAYRVMKLTADGKLNLVVQLPLRSDSSGPRDIAFDASGTLFVATPSRIYRLTSAGALGLFASGLCCMSKIEFGPDGNLYFANENTNQVMFIRPDGSTSVVTSGLQHPLDVAFSPAGEMYVSEFGKDILRVSAGGTASFFGEADFGPNDPLHITFDAKGNLYGHGNGTLFKFDSAGRDMGFKIDNDDPRYMLGYPKANPGGIAFDRNGYLYVADSPNAKITRISPDGHLEILVRGFNPNGIALGADGNIYAISSADFPQAPGELWRITPQGRLESIAKFRDAPNTMAADTLGNMYVSLTNRDTTRVVQVRPDGTVEDFLTQPRGYGLMAVAPDGRLYVATPAQGAIYRATKDGSWAVFAQGLSQRIGGGAWAFRLAFSPDGTLYAADGKTGNVIRFSDSGTFSIVSTIPALVGQPQGLFTISPVGSIFVLTNKERYSLWRIDSNGSTQKVASDIWGDPYGLVFDKDDNLYISRGGSIDRVSGLVLRK